MNDIVDDLDALEALEDVARNGESNVIQHRHFSPKVFSSSQPQSSPIRAMGPHPFRLELDDGDDEADSPYLVAHCPSFLEGRTSVGGMIQIKKRHNRGHVFPDGVLPQLKTRVPEIYDDKHIYGVPIYRLLRSLQSNPERKTHELAISEHNPLPTQKHEHLWVDKYRPKRFTDLIGDDRTNRDVMRWIQHWQYAVHGIFKAQNGQTPESQDFSVEDPWKRPVKRILLLTGPPGFGKTTLAHIAAKQAGYNVVEINARTGAVIQNKVANAVATRQINLKPTLIVIDEIDGVSAAGGDSSFIKSLVNMVISDEFASKSVGMKRQPSGQKKQKKPNHLLLRPIICICNDQYATQLQALRPYCQIIAFKSISTSSVVARLNHICHNEGLNADVRALNFLCERTSSDMRSCMNALQLVRTRNRDFTLDSMANSMSQKDTTTSVLEILQLVFLHVDKKEERRKGRTINDKVFVSRIAELVCTSNEYSKVIQGCFAQYLSHQYHDNLLAKPLQISEWLYFYDVCDRSVFERQQSELYQYLPYSIVAFHALLATPDTHVSREKSFKDWDAREKHQLIAGVMRNWVKQVKPSLRQIFNPSDFVIDLLSYSLRILGPVLTPINSQIIKTSERTKIAKVVAVMVDLGLSYTQLRVEDGSYVYQIEPNIDKALAFGGVCQIRGETFLPRRYITRQIIATELEADRLRRFTSQQELDLNALPKEALKRKEPEHSESNPVIKKDFFGRTIVKTLETEHIRGVAGTRSALIPWRIAKVWIKFNDGYSDAVRNNISIEEILQHG